MATSPRAGVANEQAPFRPGQASLCAVSLSVRSLFFALTCAAYAVATFVFALRDRSEKESTRPPVYAPMVLLVGCAAHAILVATAFASGPNASALALSVLGLAVSLLFAVIRQVTPGSDWLASVALPAATLLATVGEALPMRVHEANAGPSGAAGRPLQLALHVAANVVGEALLLFAGASAGAYLVADKRLKRKTRHAGGAMLPSLGALDRAGHHLTVAGFVLLSAGLALAPAGGLSFGGSVAIRMRTLFGLLSWGLLALVLAARTFAGWRGRKSAVGTLTSFAFASFVVAAYALRSATAGVAP